MAGAGCYMEARTPAFDQPIPPEELEEKLRAFYKRGGAFSADEAALSALDGGKGSHYFKVDYTKDGALKKGLKVYDPQMMQEMVDHMETVLKETAEGILSGNVAVRPLKGHSPDACTYCDFAGLCGYTPEAGKKKEYSEDPFGWREEAAHE
jgi:ATP-dependent helicase/nuclease subunit B